MKKIGKITELFKNYSYFDILINIVAIIFTILSYSGINSIETYSFIIFIIAMAVNLMLIYLTLDYINRNDPIGQRIKKICWAYLIFLLLAIIALMTYSLVYSFIEVGSIIRVISFFQTQIAYYIIYGLGIFTSYYNLQKIDRPETWK